ncbi:hypothetical protein HID58_009438 [Brassica napus]|uniref:Uncharacterized protein n=1 Tax=Brassica napus TaxID=3708 RepID=A0ABQ8DSL1_BRANA|nr:hypothetical protein HID58_022938 [Brassica napus]KAH0932321.1 hypothetical protein HID58_009438 [Brassica napus]
MKLSQRYGNGLPKLDIFHSMADPVIEPLLMMVNTVLSVLALVYPPKNLVVYLSDDASSQLTFYALTKAAEFAKTWAPFCKEFDIEPRSSLLFWQGLKVDEAAVDNRGVTVEVRCRLLAVGFCSYSKKPWNHSSKEKENIIVIPTLVYPSREKRPEHHHLNDEEDNNNLKRQTSAALEHLPALKSARTLEFAWYGGEIYIAGDIGGFKGNVQVHRNLNE